MRIQHNIMAMNAYRNYNNNASALSKNLEKLSSGYRINRAGDDAAGLAISEKMRAQIAGLDAAQKNVKDGISLVKTAEGALQEVQDMLNRMVTLATQSSNGTYEDAVDREALQAEVDQLRSEINRIAESANFNGRKLLDGSLQGDTTSSEVVLGAASKLDILQTASTTGAAGDVGSKTIVHEDAKTSSVTSFSVSLNGAGFVAGDSDTGTTITLTLGAGTATDGAKLELTGITADMSAEELATAYAEAYKDSGVTFGVGKKADTTTDATVKYNVTAEGDKLIFTMDETSAKGLDTDANFTGNFEVAQLGTAVTTGSTSGAAGTATGTINQNTQIITEGSTNAGEILANTQTDGITFNQAWFTDGKGVKIGDETYVLALTDETKNANYGEGYTVVDLTDLVDPTTVNTSTKLLKNDDVTLSNALTRLSEAAADNEMFSVGVKKDGAANMLLSFQEKGTYEGDADLRTVAGIEEQLQVYDKVTVKETVTKGAGKDLQLQIGDTADSYNQLKVSIKAMDSDALGIGKLSVADIDSATAAIDTIRAAINAVSSQRGDLGAIQNRLEHTQNNLSVMEENITDAESTIRDTDIADEMTAYTKNNILLQSAQAMLAQANMAPQGVLQLLQ